MKIVFISHACVASTHREKLRMLAGHDDVELFLIAPYWWEEGTRKIKLEKKDDTGFTIIPLPTMFTGKQFIHFYLNLAQHLREIDPDIIHIEEEPNSAVCFQILWLKNRLKLKAKTVLFSWQNMLQTWRLPNPRAVLYPFFEKYSLQNAHHIITGSEEGRKIFLRKGFSGDVSVIPQFGIDPDRFKKGDASELKQQLGLTNNFVIGYLGRLLKMKGLYTLLNAASGLKEDWRLLIVGEGSEKANLKNAAQRLGIGGRTTFIGSIDRQEIPAYLNCMDVLVLPSERTPNWKEQFGRVLIEAMACEVPVIGSSCGEIPNVIGNAGFIFEEKNLDDLKTKLETIFHNGSSVTGLGSMGRQRVLDRFTTQKVVRDTYGVYRKMLSMSTQESRVGSIAEQMRTYYRNSREYQKNLSAYGEDYFKGYVSWISDHVPGGSNILELGCGTGLSCRLLSRKGFKVTGLDVSHLFLKEGGNGSSGDVGYVTGDAMGLPFKDESFDAVTSMSMIEHIPDAEKALSEMVRVVKPGGVIAVMAPNLLSPFVAIKTFFRLCMRRGSMPGFASTKSQAIRWFFRNLAISWRKRLSRRVEFLYRQPDLSRLFRGDIDSVYLACQMDLKYFFQDNGMEIIQYAYNNGLQPLSRIFAKLFPNFCGACSIIVRKMPLRKDRKRTGFRIGNFFSPSSRFFKRVLSKRGKVLDLGCGGGHAFYFTIGPVIGIDLSLRPLHRARGIYDAVIQADAKSLPFGDESFDYIVSHDLIGHIPAEEKDRLISETYRVLKKGGRTAHYIETKGKNLLERFSQSHAELYRKYFIEQDGHHGLEFPHQAIRRFRRKGLRPVAEQKWSSTSFRFPKEYLKRFDNEYANKSVFVAALVGFCRVITKTKILEYPVEIMILVSDYFFGKFSSFDDSSGIYVCYEKR